MTKHYKQTLMPLHDTNWGKIYISKGNHYLMNDENEVALLPHWLWLLVEQKLELTFRWGPYLFRNNFEQTAEARYLMDMFKYRVLTATAETKVRDILNKYKLLIGINEHFTKTLIEREGCPDYWTGGQDGNKN